MTNNVTKEEFLKDACDKLLESSASNLLMALGTQPRALEKSYLDMVSRYDPADILQKVRDLYESLRIKDNT